MSDDDLLELDVPTMFGALALVDYLEYAGELSLERAAEYREEVFEAEHPEEAIRVIEKVQDRHAEFLADDDGVVSIPARPSENIQTIREEDVEEHSG